MSENPEIFLVSFCRNDLLNKWQAGHFPGLKIRREDIARPRKTRSVKQRWYFHLTFQASKELIRLS
jgi:hypothetical protein